MAASGVSFRLANKAGSLRASIQYDRLPADRLPSSLPDGVGGLMEGMSLDCRYAWAARQACASGRTSTSVRRRGWRYSYLGILGSWNLRELTADLRPDIRTVLALSKCARGRGGSLDFTRGGVTLGLSHDNCEY